MDKNVLVKNFTLSTLNDGTKTRQWKRNSVHEILKNQITA